MLTFIRTMTLMLIFALMVAKTMSADEQCSPSALARSSVLCCGPVSGQGRAEPLLMLGPKLPCSSDPDGGMLAVPAEAACCPGPRGRTCCYLPSSWSHAGPHWPSQHDQGFFVSLFAFVVLLGSTVVLLCYCCQAAISRRKKGELYIYTVSRPKYGALSFNSEQ